MVGRFVLLLAAAALRRCGGSGLRSFRRRLSPGGTVGAPTSSKAMSARARAALRELQDEGEWVMVLERNGVRVWKRGHAASDERAAFAVRATIDIPTVSPADVASLLLTRDYDVIRRFNPTIVRGEDVEWRDNNKERTTYILTKPVWPLKPRDFVCDVRHESFDGSELILNAPASHPRAPAPKNTVRGELRGLHLCETDGGAGCRYTCVHEIDPGGAAPRPLVNWFALRKPLQYMTQLRDLAADMHPA